MKFLVNPMPEIVPYGNCNCQQNSGSVRYCPGNCSTLQICVTPHGGKVSQS